MDSSSPYLKRFILIVKAGTTFSLQGQLNYPILLLVTLSCTTVILCDLVGSQKHGIQYETLQGKVYEAPVFIFLILCIPILIRKRSNIHELIQLLLEPFDDVSFGKESIEIVKNFYRWVNIIGTIVIFNNFFLFACCMVVLGPLCTLPFYPTDTDIQGLPLPMGSIPFHTESYLIYAAFYMNSGFAVLAVCAFHSSWYLLFIFSSLKIRARLRMLIHTIDTLDTLAEIRSMVLTEIALCSRHHISKEDMLTECTKDNLGEAISEHIKLIRYVRLVNDTFRLSLMIFIHAAIITDALLLQQITDATHRSVQEYAYKINMAFAGLFSVWVFSCCGQSIISESEKLRLALYNYDWTDKSPEFKQSIVLMMTAATNPLKISVGGFYSLNMISYRIDNWTVDVPLNVYVHIILVDLDTFNGLSKVVNNEIQELL